MLHIALLFCFGIQLAIQKEKSMEVHDRLRHRVSFFLICFLFLGVLEVFINFTSGLSLRSNFFGLRCVCFHMSACRNQSAKRKLVS
jgi:O-antigen/teichoic acid export membrane protein